VSGAAGGTPANNAVSHDQDQYLLFVLGKETFAVPILNIKEILEYTAPTDVPMMPAFVQGIVNLRGAAVPVIDLARRFGRSSSPITKRTCIVIVETILNEELHVFGVLVDAVNAVLEIAQSDIEAPPPFGAAVRTDFIRGMGKVDGRFVIILSVEDTLSMEEMNALATAAPV
jgi:purine-binding chemotaxis protein CheW